MEVRSMRQAILVLGLVTMGAPPAGRAQDAAGRPPYLDPDLDFERRAADLVSRMTLEEKLSQLTNDAAAIPRLGIPAYEWWNECLHGVARAGAATVFPQAIGLAATFDTALMREVATAIADEARAKHHEFARRGQRGRYQGLTFWSPNINIFRDPRWGRGQETYGEDPYLTARMGVEFVKGLQGDDPRYLEGGRHRQALRRAQRPRARPPHASTPVRASATSTRPTCPRSGPSSRRRRSYSVMGAYNRDQRRVGLGQPAPAPRHPAAGLGLRRATSSPTAGPSTTSTRATRSSPRPRRRPRSACARGATSSAARPTSPWARPSPRASSPSTTSTWRSSA